jgi:lipopolysaccharide/colanic/teichoic acid biosynthesis glycosyltransferase
MVKQMLLPMKERIQLSDALFEKYGTDPSFLKRLTYLRKKYFWIFVTKGAALLKRLIDVLVSLTTLLLLSPLFLLIALLLRIQNNGPIFYVSDRVGLWGREFRFYKFRSMRPNAAAEKETLLTQSGEKQHKRFKMRKDPRITWLGTILRKTSLDEFPQFWNVLIGDMSLVGPRPPLPEEVALYTLEERRRLDVKPGLTCFWQVSGRSEIPFDKQVQLDIRYIESQSIWLDLKLLIKTIPAVLLGKGAY